MPELAEIETLSNNLRQQILGQKIIQAELFRKNLRIDFPENFEENVTGKYIVKIERRAKYLQLFLDDDNIIIVHLGMSGRLINYPIRRENILKHDHVIFDLENGNELALNDPRRFGLMTLINKKDINEHILFTNLGIEPLTEEFNADYLFNKLQNRQVPIKTFIMDNKILVGVGNIYASESLFRSNILPMRLASSLTIFEATKLATKIKETLLDAIEAGGSSLKDYVNLDGLPGYFQNNFFVYDRFNDDCKICTSKIQKIKQAGRMSFYCNKCQV